MISECFYISKLFWLLGLIIGILIGILFGYLIINKKPKRSKE